MEYSPPPLFKQGASARAKAVIFAFISLALLLVDARMHALTLIRQAVGTALYPLQVAAMLPRDGIYAVGNYFQSTTVLERENKSLKRQQILNAQTLQQAQHLMAENAQLRRLLNASAQLPAKSVLAEILYDARDPFTRKIIVNRGMQNGVVAGQPVIDDQGIVGQVTRVFPLTSEVTLLTDKDQAIPVQDVRSGLRSIAYGRGSSGVLDLRFMPINADIKQGDVLVTSGIDGVYPAGLAVAKVASVENKPTDDFARIRCLPVAGIDRNRQLLILLVDTRLAPRPEADDAGKDRKGGKKRAADSGKELPKDGAKDATKEAAKDAKAAAAAPVTAAANKEAVAKEAAAKAPAQPVNPVKTP